MPEGNLPRPRISKDVASDELAKMISHLPSEIAGKVTDRIETEDLRAVAMHDGVAIDKPAVKVVLRDSMRRDSAEPVQGFGDGAVPDSLSDLLDTAPLADGRATQANDGRHIPIVLAVLRDESGTSISGAEVRLRNPEGRELDMTRSDASGLAVLRFLPPDLEGEGVDGTVEVVGGTTTQLHVPSEAQHVVRDIPADGRLATEVPGDIALHRLPSDFSAELCRDVLSLGAEIVDPILGRVATDGDFRGRRTPIIRRMTIPRAIADAAGSHRRYLVRVRQEWVFAGYTLGELVHLDPLAPGSLLEELISTVSRTVEQAERSADRALQEVTTLARSALTQLSSIDTLVTVASTNEVSNVTNAGASTDVNVGVSAGVKGGGPGAIIGGIIGGVLGGPLGALGGALVGGVFGGAKGHAGVGTLTAASTSLQNTLTTKLNAATRTNVDASLQVNNLVQTARSMVNEQVRTLTSTVQGLEQSLSRSTVQVAPLLDRVTNLVHWTMYENYVVSTAVEDVTEVIERRILPPPSDKRVQVDEAYSALLEEDVAGVRVPLFTDEDIVEYRRLFEPALLDERLAVHFVELAEGIAHRRMVAGTVRGLHLQFEYSDAEGPSALYLEPPWPPAFGERETQDRSGSFSFVWQPQDGLQVGEELRFRVYLWTGDSARLRLDGVKVWYGGEPIGPPHEVQALNVRTSGMGAQKQVPVVLTVRQRGPGSVDNPLFRHINRNRTHYFGVLAQAALTDPSLRADCPQLASFGPDHALWRLPILGFEGGSVFVSRPVDNSDPNVLHMLDDPGAATVVQLAAPGAYGESLGGLLTLAGDVAGKVHPALLPSPPAIPSAVPLLDLAGLLPDQTPVEG